jgi:hypothetical protein
MLWSEVRRWAKSNGYHSSKDENGYSWYKSDNPSMNGVEKSVSKLARAIYNKISGDIWIEYQEEYKLNN